MDAESIPYIKEAAKIYENQLGNIDMAIETWSQITENFPGTEEAQNARAKIEELSQQI